MGACCCCGFCPPKRLDEHRQHSNQHHKTGGHNFGLHSTAQHFSTTVRRTKSQIELENMSSLVHEVVDTADFEEQLKEAGNKLVVVDFFATWCGPCKIVGPKVELLAGQFTDVIFLKVDVDDCEEIASRYTISCMPTFLLFKSGEQVAEFSGANSEKVKDLILQHK